MINAVRNFGKTSRFVEPARFDHTAVADQNSLINERGLITIQVGVNFDGPLIDAARHTLRFRKSLLTQELSDS